LTILDAPAQVAEAQMPGVAPLPHSLGQPSEGAGLRVAPARCGANVNRLGDDQAVDRAVSA
jgi:hypothetical protein